MSLAPGHGLGGCPFQPPGSRQGGHRPCASVGSIEHVTNIVKSEKKNLKTRQLVSAEARAGRQGPTCPCHPI